MKLPGLTQNGASSGSAHHGMEMDLLVFHALAWAGIATRKGRFLFFKACRYCCEVALCLPRSALVLHPWLLRGYLSAMTKQIMCEGGLFIPVLVLETPLKDKTKVFILEKKPCEVETGNFFVLLVGALCVQRVSRYEHRYLGCSCLCQGEWLYS